MYQIYTEKILTVARITKQVCPNLLLFFNSNHYIHIMRYIELFCGCGGTAVGLSHVGWECVLAVDNDPYALSLYKSNFKTHRILQHDLNLPLPAQHLNDIGVVDVVVGGAPCQDFSNAGFVKRKRHNVRAALTERFLDHVLQIQPTWVVFENVKCAKNRSQFKNLVDGLITHGYHVEYTIRSTAELGMAQNRHRLILIASKNREKLTRVWNTFINDRTPTRFTIRQTFERDDIDVPTEHIYYPTASLNNRPSVFSVDGFAPTIRGRARPLPKTYRFVTLDSTTDQNNVTALSSNHLASLQQFPPDYIWHGPATRLNQCIGNAVPPPLAAAFAAAIDSVVTHDVSRVS